MEVIFVKLPRLTPPVWVALGHIASVEEGARDPEGTVVILTNGQPYGIPCSVAEFQQEITKTIEATEGRLI